MKINIKAAFPFSFTRVISELRIPASCVIAFREAFPPHYKTRLTGRYSRIPEEAKNCFKIVKLGDGAPHVVSAFHEAGAAMFSGSKEECKAMQLEIIKNWWSLPKGREIETYFSRLKMKEAK